MKSSEDFQVLKGGRVVINHRDGWRYVIEVSADDDGDMGLYDMRLEELGSDDKWVVSHKFSMWDASFPALAEAFRFLSLEG